MSSRYCGCILLLATPISLRWMGHREARLAWGRAWPFACKMLQIEKCSKIQISQFCSHCAGMQNSANSCQVFWRCGQALNPPKDIFSIRIRPLDLGDYILSQKLLVDIDFDKFASKTGHRGVMLATLLFSPFCCSVSVRGLHFINTHVKVKSDQYPHVKLRGWWAPTGDFRHWSELYTNLGLDLYVAYCLGPTGFLVTASGGQVTFKK